MGVGTSLRNLGAAALLLSGCGANKGSDDASVVGAGGPTGIAAQSFANQDSFRFERSADSLAQVRSERIDELTLLIRKRDTDEIRIYLSQFEVPLRADLLGQLYAEDGNDIAAMLLGELGEGAAEAIPAIRARLAYEIATYNDLTGLALAENETLVDSLSLGKHQVSGIETFAVDELVKNFGSARLLQQIAGAEGVPTRFPVIYRAER